jgi:hypothetical protein
VEIQAVIILSTNHRYIPQQTRAIPTRVVSSRFFSLQQWENLLRGSFRAIQMMLTHSADGTDDVAARWLCAKPARSVRRRGSGAGCDGARLVMGGTGALLLPSQARAPGSRRNLGAHAWFPPKVVASGTASKLSTFHLVQ